MQQHATNPSSNLMLQRRLLAAALVTGLVLPTLADEAHGHFDLSPSVVNGQIVSNGWSDAEQEFLPGERVFAYELGEGSTPGDGNESFAADPGINVRPGNGFLGNPGLRIIGPLTYWAAIDAGPDSIFDPSDVSFAPVSDPAVFLRLSVGAQQRTITGTSGTLADLFLNSTHAHYNALLTDTSGDHLDTISDPPLGIYQFQAQIVSTDGSLLASDAIFINFNYGADEQAHAASIEYTENVLVPEPGSALILLAGAGLLVSRRRISASA